jgi:Flp pilus assembly CpaF family ATPase
MTITDGTRPLDPRRSTRAAGSAAPSTLVQSIRRDVLDRLTEANRSNERAGRPAMTAVEQEALGREFVVESLGAYARDALANGVPVLAADIESDVEQRCIDALFGLGRLQRLLDDEAIENINANGCDRVFVRYADGSRERVDAIADSDEEMLDLLQRAAARLGHNERRLDRAQPFVSLQLPMGARFVGTYSVSDRPCLSIRRHRYLRVTPDDLVRLGTFDRALRSFFGAAMRARKSLVISGGANAGKTTTLRAIAADIAPEERLVTIEDSYELGLGLHEDLHPDVVALEAREANIEGEGEVTLADLVRHALRLSPDRVIVGEARGAEVLALLNAMSQGNDGSMATIHASSSRGAFGKIATYAVQAPERLPLEATNLLIANAVHFVVHLEKDRRNARFVSSVREVLDADGPLVTSNEVFRPGPGGRAVPGAPFRHDTLEELIANGFEPDLLEAPEGWWHETTGGRNLRDGAAR